MKTYRRCYTWCPGRKDRIDAKVVDVLSGLGESEALEGSENTSRKIRSGAGRSCRS